MFKMQGVVPPMITPFDKDGKLDEGSLRTLVAFLKKIVDGLFICGSYGSGPMMSLEERKKVAELCKEICGEDIPLIVHTGTTNTKDTVELSLHAKTIGCDAVAAVGPFYFKHKNDSIVQFYESIMKAVGRDFPVYVYHNPDFSGYEISLDTFKELKKRGIHGIKDATFDILTFASYMRQLADNTFDVALGTEAMWLSACVLGCKSYIPGLGNAFPEICRKMWIEGTEERYDACRETQFIVNEMRDIMYLARSTQLAVYAMLDIRDIIRAYPRSPFVPAQEEEKKAIKKALVNLGVI